MSIIAAAPTRWASALSAAVLLGLLFFSSSGAVAEAVEDVEEIFFDKADCDPGPHKVDATAKVGATENPVAPDIFNVRWKTTAAEEDIVLEVYREWAPLGADRFYRLVLDNYYNCGAFFRVVPGKFLICILTVSSRWPCFSFVASSHVWTGN